MVVDVQGEVRLRRDLEVRPGLAIRDAYECTVDAVAARPDEGDVSLSARTFGEFGGVLVRGLSM